MIKEDYVSFETAKLLKEKGFNAEIDTYYSNEGDLLIWSPNEKKSYLTNDGVETWWWKCIAPTLQMAMKWLREKGFYIFVPIEIDYDEDERGDKWYYETYYPEIRRVSDGKIMYDNGSLYAEPEQACEAAIKYCLENLITK